MATEMKEVKSPKKPLIYYYGIALLLIFLFNIIVMPMIAQEKVKEVDYGTFMSMAEAIIEKLAKKRKKLDNCGENLSEYETELLETLIYGGDFVEAKRLCEIVSWYKNDIT